jgi:hypothetical protein
MLINSFILITYALLFRGVALENCPEYLVSFSHRYPISIVNSVELRQGIISKRHSITFSTLSCNQGIPHTRPGIYKSSRRSRCARTRQRQPFLISRELMTNFEMLTVKFCSICTSPWVLISSLCAIVFLHKFRRRPALPFPPGPKGLPILGNALDIPRVNPWLTYWQWGKKCSKYFPYSASVESAHYIFLER